MKNRINIIGLVTLFAVAITPSPAKSEEVDTSGIKVLTAFNVNEYNKRDDDHKAFDAALKEANVKILKSYGFEPYLLLDCGTQKPEDVLAKIPHHAGAIIFSEGNFVKAIPSPDKMETFDANGDTKKVPKNYAVLRWGSDPIAAKEMDSDVEKYSKMDGVVARLLNTVPEKEREETAGNTWFLKLTPGAGKTLLDMFLLAEGEFDY